MAICKTKLVILVLTLILLGCEGSGDAESTIAAQSTRIAELTDGSHVTEAAVTPEDQNLSTPTGVVALSTPSLGATKCDADKWSFTPTSVYTLPAEDGFKYILITLAIENNSPYGASFRFGSHFNTFITTEDGFTYEITKNLDFPPDSPYVLENFPGATLPLYVESSGAGASLLPGFATQGWVGFELGWPVEHRFQLIYKVAASQNHFKVTISLPSIGDCYYPDRPDVLEFVRDKAFPLEPIILDLDQDIRDPSYPTTRPDTDFKDIHEPIDIPSKGSLQFIDVLREDNGDVVVIRFKFANASAGYQTSGVVTGYLMGDDGFQYFTAEDGGFDVGPGQEGEVELHFWTGTRAKNFKFWMRVRDNDITSETDLYQAIYNLPDE